MTNSHAEFLFHFGWSPFFESQVAHLVSNSLKPARIICEERNLYRVQTGHDQIFWASIRGKMQFSAMNREDFPAVGDWVLVEIPQQSDRGIISQVLDRKTVLRRKQVGSTSHTQILSSNVDYVFITSSMNADLNLRRIDRYLTLVRDAGAEPIILLTKADLCLENVQEVVAKVESEFPDVRVHTLSQLDFSAADYLASYLRLGTTSVFVGSSGVGKSTLVNFLIGGEAEEQIKTQEIRVGDGKGRHTTTSRNMYKSRYGGLIIDTPGMRELQLSDHSEGVQSHFADLEELFLRCKFSNCQHQSEPGCAVIAALEIGNLEEERWNSYQKLQAEVRFEMRKQDKGLASEERKKWRKLNMEGRARGRNKKGGDF